MSRSMLVFPLAVVILSILLIVLQWIFFGEQMIVTAPWFMWTGLAVIVGGIVLIVIIVKEIRKGL